MSILIQFRKHHDATNYDLEYCHSQTMIRKIQKLYKVQSIPKIDKWSILGIATALSAVGLLEGHYRIGSSGSYSRKRQDGDSEVACPTPNKFCFIKIYIRTTVSGLTTLWNMRAKARGSSTSPVASERHPRQVFQPSLVF